MLDINYLRKDLAAAVARLETRKSPQPFLDVERFSALESERKQVQTRTEELQARRNALSKQIGMKKGKGEDASTEMAEVGGKGSASAAAAAAEEKERKLAAIQNQWLEWEDLKRSPVHVITDGVYANPEKVDGKWTIPAEVTLANTGTNAMSALVNVEVYDSSGKKIAGGKSKPVNLVPMDQAVAKVSIPVKSLQLWSVEHPNLYTVRTTVMSGGQPVDSVETACGFRTIRFDAQKGFFLNDQPLKLQGTCNHQDHAGVGVALPDSLWEFRVTKLKEMGANAYRTSHHPPAKELLEQCDRQGMLVMDETRHFNASPEYLKQLEWLVRRDRNHPSVIL